MRLEDKLKNLAGLGSAGQKDAAPLETKDRLVRLLDGRTASNRYGEFVEVTRRFSGEDLHQEVKLPRSWDVKGTMLSRICRVRKEEGQEACPIPFEPGQAVFFDCETTGLAGGVGTYAFLVGVGYMSQGDFVVEQYFMQDFHQEGAILSAVADRLCKFKFLVSFNGKCYDLPLLENRWTIHRIDFDSRQWFHIDLLYPSRRLWKKRIGDCSLANIESEILGVERKIDVPSYLVPQIYFDYLRTGEAEPLIPVFHHNVYDILSLFRLSVLIDGALEDFGAADIRDPLDFYSLGRIHQNLGNHRTSVQCFEQALSSRLSPELQLDVYTKLAFLHKKRGRLEEAAQIWHRLVGRDLPVSLCALVELAKYYEHKRKDCQRALIFVDSAISHLSCDLSASTLSAHQGKLDSLEYRKARLKRKIKRASKQA